MANIKAIASQEDLLKKLKKEHILTFQNRFYLSDRHKLTVNRNLVEKFWELKIIEQSSALAQWFEKGFRLKDDFRKCKNMKEIKVKIKELISDPK